MPKTNRGTHGVSLLILVTMVALSRNRLFALYAKGSSNLYRLERMSQIIRMSLNMVTFLIMEGYIIMIKNRIASCA